MLDLIDSRLYGETNVAVHKFGGSSLSNPQRLNNVIDIISKHTSNEDYIIVSANGEVTDWLLAFSEGKRQMLDKVRDYYTDLVRAVLKTSSTWLANFESSLIQLANVDYSVDKILSHGEVWSATLLVELLNQQNQGAKFVDARDIFKCRSVEEHRTFDADYCIQGIRKAAYGNYTKRLIITGYIAKTHAGDTVTLGRNGSDYSATLLAKLCNASRVTLWTDVEGIFTADPALVATSQVVDFLSYGEANALASVGTGVLHQKTLRPLLANKIPLLVRSSLKPHKPGTAIGEIAQYFNTGKPMAKSVALKKQLRKLKVNFITTEQRKLFLQRLSALSSGNHLICHSTTDKELTLVVEDSLFTKISGLNHDGNFELEDNNSYSVIGIVGQDAAGKSLAINQLKDYLREKVNSQLTLIEKGYLCYLVVQSSEAGSLLAIVHEFYFEQSEPSQRRDSGKQQNIIEAAV